MYPDGKTVDTEGVICKGLLGGEPPNFLKGELLICKGCTFY